MIVGIKKDGGLCVCFVFNVQNVLLPWSVWISLQISKVGKLDC